ncbi:MAG: glycosyltransferase [Blastochloris sp.]|nr:glycosyltransferase [Blastochloris sp.]
MISQMACDVILHTSSIGESFGYGLAEPMALGKPVITNSVPWHDQAQIELVRHGECGLIASTLPSMKAAILRMAENEEWRVKCGELAREHILKVANPSESTNRLEMAMKCAIEGLDNPHAEQDLEKALQTGKYLDKHQWGHCLGEQWWLRSRYFKVTCSRYKNRRK